MHDSILGGTRGRSLDFSGFAHEFLRHNWEYRRQYVALGKLAAREPLAPTCREMARPWGLNFPGLSGGIR